MSKGNPGQAGAGGLNIRDEFGSWIKEFAINSGLYSSVIAELCAVVPGLESAWMLGFLKVILESDSKLVVQLIMQLSITVEANYSLIAKPKELLDRERKIKVQYVYREANQATDWLAKFILSMNSLDRSNWILNDTPENSNGYNFVANYVRI